MDLARLTEEERAWLAMLTNAPTCVRDRQTTLLTRLALARAVVEAARRLNKRMPTGSVTAKDIPLIAVLDVCVAVVAHDAEAE